MRTNKRTSMKRQEARVRERGKLEGEKELKRRFSTKHETINRGVGEVIGVYVPQLTYTMIPFHRTGLSLLTMLDTSTVQQRGDKRKSRCKAEAKQKKQRKQALALA